MERNAVPYEGMRSCRGIRIPENDRRNIFSPVLIEISKDEDP